MKAKEHWNWIVCLGLAAATAAWGYFSFLPQRRAIRQLLGEACQKEEHVLSAGGLPLALDHARQELDRTEAFNCGWRKRSPDSRALTELYGRIYEAVGLSGATTTRFEPHAPESFDTIRRTRFSLGCSGSYTAIQDVLARLESLDIPLQIESLQMGVSAEDAKKVSCEAKVVVFSDNPKNSH